MGSEYVCLCSGESEGYVEDAFSRGVYLMYMKNIIRSTKHSGVAQTPRRSASRQEGSRMGNRSGKK